MTITNNATPYRDRTTPHPSNGGALRVLHRVWPPASLALALIANVIWIGLLGYGLAKLF
jgi:hypothetical protein